MNTLDKFITVIKKTGCGTSTQTAKECESSSSRTSTNTTEGEVVVLVAEELKEPYYVNIEDVNSFPLESDDNNVEDVDDDYTINDEYDTDDSRNEIAENDISDSVLSENESEEAPKQKRQRNTKKRYHQKYRTDWSLQFKWLINKNGKSFCKLCSTYISGSIVHIKRHQKSNKHSKKARIVASAVDCTTLIGRVPNTNSLKNNIKKCELKLLMFLAEHNLALSIMDHLPKLASSAALDSTILKSISCSRTKSTQMLKCFSKEHVENIRSQLQLKKYSLIVDETTDISTNKCLAILVRFVEKNKVSDRLLSLVEVKDCTAAGITKEILNTLKTLSIPINNLVGFAADNATVMMGNHSGVQAKLKEINEHIFVIGCVCHSMALCASAASLKLPKQIEDFVRDVYSYFANSSKRQEELKEFQEFVNMKPRKLLRPCQTRWLSLETVVHRLILLWTPMELFFKAAVEEDHLQAAATIYNAICNPIYKLYLLFLSYILPLINKINLQFQSQKSQLFMLHKGITTLFKVVVKNYMKSTYVARCEKIEDINPKEIHQYLPLEQIYVGANAQIYITNSNIKPEDLKAFQLKCLDYYIELAYQIKSRFTNFTKNYRHFEILDPATVLSETQPSIIPLLTQFKHLVEDDHVEFISSEFRELPELATEIKDKLKLLDFEQFWFEVMSLKDAANTVFFPHLSEFISKMLCFPHSSAAAERIFSHVNLIKTKCRNRLSTESMNNLLQAKDLLGSLSCYNWEPSRLLMARNIEYK